MLASRMETKPLIKMTLRRDRTAAAKARRALEAVALPGGTYAERTAALLATEFVNNAVLHGGGDEIRFEVQRGRDSLRVEVADDGNGFDPRQRTVRDDPGGWGLELVDQLASDWGMYEGSTHVWFELRA